MRTDKQKHRPSQDKKTIAFRNFAKAPINSISYIDSDLTSQRTLFAYVGKN